MALAKRYAHRPLSFELFYRIIGHAFRMLDAEQAVTELILMCLYYCQKLKRRKRKGGVRA